MVTNCSLYRGVENKDVIIKITDRRLRSEDYYDDDIMVMAQKALFIMRDEDSIGRVTVVDWRKFSKGV